MSEKDLARKYRLQQWRAAIQDQKASGLTIKEWCLQHNVTEYQYHYRQRVLRRFAAAALEKHLEGDNETAAENELSTLSTQDPEKQLCNIAFAQVPESLLVNHESADAAVTVRLQTQKALIEVTSLNAEQALAFLREVTLHG